MLDADALSWLSSVNIVIVAAIAWMAITGFIVGMSIFIENRSTNPVISPIVAGGMFFVALMGITVVIKMA